MEPIEPGFDGAEIAWHENGDDVPAPWIGAALAMLAAIVLLVACTMALLAPPANREPAPGTQGGPAVPSTYGPPPGSN
jgi:hypothetical protein